MAGFTQGRTQRVVFAQYEQKRKELHSRLGPRKKEGAIFLSIGMLRTQQISTAFFQLEWKKMENKLAFKHISIFRGDKWYLFFSIPAQLSPFVD